jgi:carbon monoxide dehydrogenase subunit G
MKFENTFEVAAPIDQVYDAMMDVERVAPCVPGAQVLDRKSDDAYEVAIKVKVGPMSMLYKGTVEIVDREPEAHRAQMRARARESRGQGNADAQVEMKLTSDNGTTRGTIDTDVKLSGKAAAMGGGVIKEVSGKLVDQFAQNLAAMLGEGAEPGTQPTPEAAAAAGPATPTAPTEGAEAAGPATPAEPAPSSPEAPVPTEPTPAATQAAGPATPSAAQPPAEAEALDVGNLVGTMLVSRLRDPKVLGGLGLLIALLLLLRRRR